LKGHEYAFRGSNAAAENRKNPVKGLRERKKRQIRGNGCGTQNSRNFPDINFRKWHEFEKPQRDRILFLDGCGKVW
jgi:hypothetical protein